MNNLRGSYFDEFSHMVAPWLIRKTNDAGMRRGKEEERATKEKMDG